MSKKHLSRRALLEGGRALLIGTGAAFWLTGCSQAAPQHILHTFQNDVISLAWSPKAPLLAIFNENDIFQVWNTTSYMQTHSAPPFLGSGPEGMPFTIWSPDGRSLATYDPTHYFRVWKVADWSWRTAPTYQIVLHEVRLQAALAWSPDSHSIAVGDNSNTILIFDVSTASIGNAKSAYAKHQDMVTALAWSPDGKSLLSASRDGTVQIWDAATGKTRLTYTQHQGYPVTVMAQSPDGRLIASATGPQNTDPYDQYPGPKTVDVWETATGALVSRYHGHTAYLNALAWSPDGNFIASATGPGDDVEHTVQVWRPRQSENGYVYQGHTRPVNAITWAPDSRTIASASVGDAVQIWQPG